MHRSMQIDLLFTKKLIIICIVLQVKSVKNYFFYRQLLDLRVAQLLGVKVCPINQSVELPDGLYKTLLGHVYAHSHHIVVRGDISKNELIALGVNAEIISVAPDSAFRTQVPFIQRNAFVKKIGINFTPKTYNPNQVDPFLASLIADGYELTFVTNDPYGDMGVAKTLQAKFNIDIQVETLNYKDYVKSLQFFDLIISSRLHTNELALTGGIPILPIEGNLHKTTEVFNFLNYPLNAVHYKSEHYRDDLVKTFREAIEKYASINQWISNSLENIRVLSNNNISYTLS